MIRSFIAASAVIVVGLTAGSAFAADFSNRLPPVSMPAFAAPVAPEVPFTWTGLYVGGEAAYSWNTMPFSVWCGDQLFTDPKSTKNGFSFGPVAGARYQFGNNIVVGILGSYDFSNNFDKEHSVKFGNTWHADGQLGYALGRLLPYVSAGIVGTKTTLVGGPQHNYPVNRIGWSAGGGLDYALTDNIVIGAYGRYNDFGSKKTAVSDGMVAKTSLTSEEVGLRLVYKF